MKPKALAKVATDIVISYLSNRKVPVSDMNILVGGVCAALNALGAPVASATPPRKRESAIAARDSVRSDVVICLVCGKKRLTLRRHLGVKHGLSPEQYRERFNLAADYPLDAAAYTKVRSDLAKARGLGKKIVWEDRPRADPDRRRRKRREGGQSSSALET